MLIRRIDHPIICVRDRGPWVAAFRRVLGVAPIQSLEGDERGFSNAEIAIGDGLVGVVEPASETSPLLRTLDAYGEGYLGLSLDVGDLAPVAAHLTQRGIAFRQAKGAHVESLIWPSPKASSGVTLQLTPGLPVVQGANPACLGITEVVLAVKDAKAAEAAFRAMFDAAPGAAVESADLGYRGVRLAISNPPFDEGLVLAEADAPQGPLAQHLAAKGESVFQFTIVVSDLDAERRRLEAEGVAFSLPARALSPDRLWISPEELLGVRVELRQA